MHMQELQEILNSIMQGIVNIITLVLASYYRYKILVFMIPNISLQGVLVYQLATYQLFRILLRYAFDGYDHNYRMFLGEVHVLFSCINMTSYYMTIS